MPQENGFQLGDLIAYWPFDEGQGNITKDTVSGLEDKIEFALQKGRFQPPQNPIWRNGISGSALLFDGYSTYIRRPAEEVQPSKEGFSLSVWVAPRTYDYGADNRLAAIVNQHHRERAEGYLLGISRHGAWSLQLGLDGQWTEIWSNERIITLNSWSFVVAVYDREASELKLYLNGEEAASKQVSGSPALIPSSEDLLVGRNNQGVILAESFIMNHFNGLMDELMIHNRALDGDEIALAYREFLEPHEGHLPVLFPEDVAYPRALYSGDRHRPQFHLNSPGHWMNEPHGPIYFNGQYHLFYQYNPNGPFWHYIHWGHWVSEDLVHWRDLPPALYPDSQLDPEGIWSGSSCLDENNLPALFFTAGNNSWIPNQAVALARSTYPRDGDNDLVHWTKHPEPIIMQEPGEGLLGEFRDPFVWKEDEQWFMLMGTGVEGKGGTATVYSSSDFKEWKYRGPLYMSDYAKYPFLGTAWELPVLLPLNRAGKASGKYVFLISPWGPGSKVEVMYWVGVFNKSECRFIPDHEQPLLIDVGDFHFTGPSGMMDPKTGRSLLFTIAQGERTPEIDYDCGWSHSAGMPVSLYLREDGQLGVEPIEEISQLRGDQLYSSAGTEAMSDINTKLASIHGDMLEIRICFDSAAATKYGVSLRRSPDAEEETIIYYDRVNKELMVNRERTTLDDRERTTGIQGGSLLLEEGEALQLHIFVDRSLIEAYANGIKSLTTRAYPSRSDATGLQIWADGPVERISMEIWEMTPAFEVGS